MTGRLLKLTSSSGASRPPPLRFCRRRGWAVRWLSAAAFACPGWPFARRPTVQTVRLEAGLPEAEAMPSGGVGLESRWPGSRRRSVPPASATRSYRPDLHRCAYRKFEWREVIEPGRQRPSASPLNRSRPAPAFPHQSSGPAACSLPRVARGRRTAGPPPVPERWRNAAAWAPRRR